MKHKTFLPVLALGILALGLALQAGAPKTETVSYKSGDETVSGYLALPDGAGKHPAIIVIHEWWGLNDWVKEQAQKYAAQGYVALAVDLYRGKVATNQDEAHVLMRGLPDDRGMRDLEAAFTYLSSRPDVNASKIGSIGWCMGGSWSLKLAVDQPKLAACVVKLWLAAFRAGACGENQSAGAGEFRRGRSGHSPKRRKSIRSRDENRRKSRRHQDL
jgi:carboxymethylenebutenolidase